MTAWKVVDLAFESYYPKRPGSIGRPLGRPLRYEIGTTVESPPPGVFVHIDRDLALSKVDGPHGASYRVLELSFDEADVLGVDPETPLTALRISRVRVVAEVDSLIGDAA